MNSLLVSFLVVHDYVLVVGVKCRVGRVLSDCLQKTLGEMTVDEILIFSTFDMNKIKNIVSANRFADHKVYSAQK